RPCVTLHGDASGDERDAALNQADLAINLRDPSLGEEMFSQLRIWDHSLPTLVSSVGSYATLPPAAVAHVRPGHEVEDVRHYLAELLAHREAFARRGDRGRRLLEENHSPSAYAEVLLRLCAEAATHRPRALAYYLAGRAGAAMRDWAGHGEQALLGVA